MDEGREEKKPRRSTAATATMDEKEKGRMLTLQAPLPVPARGGALRPTTLLPKVVMTFTPRRSTSEVTAAELRVLAQSPTYEGGCPWLAHLASSYAASWDVLRSLCRHSGAGWFCMCFISLHGSWDVHRSQKQASIPRKGREGVAGS